MLSCISHVWLFCDPMDWQVSGSSVHGILQVRILEWVAISFSRGSSRPRDRTCNSCIAGGFFTPELPRKPWNNGRYMLLHICKNPWNVQHKERTLCKLWTLVDDVLTLGHWLEQTMILAQGNDGEQSCVSQAKGLYGGSRYFPLNFAVNLKLI